MAEQHKIIYSDSGRFSEDPVFLDTEVSVRTLLGYLEKGETLDYFLTRYPEVKREYALAFLDKAATATTEVSVVKKYETVVTSGLATLRALMTLNGGATIAFLTFIGHLGEKGSLPPKAADEFIAALIWYVAGTFSAVLGYGTIFMTNTYSYAETKYRLGRKMSDWLFLVTMLCGAAALLFFVAASLFAVAGFKLATGASP
jgi:uncharacterized protein (DUF433 family)